ncbi:MAG: tetratricopeptide repeat protein [Armatimonadota bacterium]
MDILNPESHNEKARRLWESGRYDDAIQSWRQALTSNPESVEALTSLAWALGQQETVEEATAFARRAVELSPEDPAARRVFGELLFLEGHYQEAADHYTAGLKHNERGHELLTACLRRDLGDVYYMLGDFEQAKRQYDAALVAGGDQAYCHLWLGWTKQQLGDRQGALAEFHLACDLAPEWHEAYYAAGQSSCALGSYDQARDLLVRALSLYPSEDEEGRSAGTCELGNAYRGLGDFHRAVGLYKEALLLDPTHPVARFNLGLACSEMGEFEAALAAFDVAAQLDPGDADVQVERGRACLELDRHDQALEAYRAALEIQPGNAEAYSGLGLTYYALGIYDTSAEHYRSAVESEPRDPWPRYNLALALDAAGRHADADVAIEQAWELGQDDPHICVALARALTAQGRSPTSAARAARRACGLDPDNADAHDALAMALHSAGDYRGALGPALEATRLMPESAEYHYTLGLVQEAAGDLLSARASFTRSIGLAPGFEEAREALRRLEESS